MSRAACFILPCELAGELVVTAVEELSPRRRPARRTTRGRPMSTQGAGQRLIWCCRHGRLRLANSTSLHVRSWKCLFTRCSVRRAAVAEWYGPKYLAPSGVGRRTTSSRGHSSAFGLAPACARCLGVARRLSPPRARRCGRAGNGRRRLGLARRGGAGKPERDEVLVVPELDVVPGPVLLDEVVLEDRRLLLVGRDDGLEVADRSLQDGDERAVVAVRVLEVAPHARAQALGLADVDDDLLLVLEEVDARLRGQRVELLDDGIGEHPRRKT